MRVDHIRFVLCPYALEVIGKHSHVLKQVILWQLSGGTSIDMVERDTRGERHTSWHVRIVAARMNSDLGAQCSKSFCQLGNVHILATRVDTAEDCERARVFGHHCDLHAVTSSRTRSQSARNR